MPYEIKQYSIDQAKKHGYTIKISSNKKKKLDVYKDGIKICSIGDLLYMWQGRGWIVEPKV